MEARAIAAWDGVCVLDRDHHAHCVGIDEPPPSAALYQSTVGVGYACGLTCSGRITGWGSGAPARIPRRGGYVDLDAVPPGLCALREDGQVDCVGVTLPGFSEASFSDLE